MRTLKLPLPSLSLLSLLILTTLLPTTTTSQPITHSPFNPPLTSTYNISSLITNANPIYPSIPQTPIFMPPGCTCKETSLESVCLIYECECTCDLTAGVCDIGCCCDTECTDSEISRFDGVDGAGCIDTPFRINSSGGNKCYSSKALSEINPKYPVRVNELTTRAYRNLLCIETDNSAISGEYYNVPSSRESSNVYPNGLKVFNEFGKEFDVRTYTTQDPLTASSSDSVYDAGEVIPCGFADPDDPGGSVSCFNGGLPLPMSDGNGVCNDVNKIQFLNDVDDRDNACVRQVSAAEWTASPADVCVSMLGYARFTSDIYAGVNQNVNTGPSKDLTTSTEYTNVAIDAMVVLSGGSKVAYDDSIHATVYDAGNGVCQNALNSLRYDIAYTAAGTIQAVTAQLQIQDVPVNTANVEQYYGVEFTPFTATTQKLTLASNNLVSRSRSGNPGYITGLPLLAGTVHPDEMKAVASLENGLSLMSPGVGGSCLSGSGFDSRGTVVGFGVDLSVSCSIELTKAELKNVCEATASSDSTMLSTLVDFGSSNRVNLIIPSYISPPLANEGMYFGIFGNADPLDITQWILVSTAASVTNEDFDSLNGRCEGLPTEMSIDVLWRKTGAVGNGQVKVISALLSYSNTPSLIHTDHTSSSSSSTVKQRFTFRQSVTFTELLDSSEVYKPERPPIIFSVPWDVLYPFSLNSAASRNGAVGGVGWILGVVGLTFIGGWFM